MVNSAVSAAMESLMNRQPNMAGAGQAESNVLLTAVNNRKLAFKAEDVGYFHPDLDPAHGTDDIISNARGTIYRDVHMFTDRLRDMEPVYGGPVLRANVVRCLRGRAQVWYSTQLSDLEKEDLRAGQGVTNWTNALIRKFRESHTVALSKLQGERYTTLDARNRREPTDYVYSVVREARAASFDKESQQLTYAYNALDPELRALLDEPDEKTSVEEFLKAVERKKNAWFDIHQPHRSNRIFGSQTQFQQQAPRPTFRPIGNTRSPSQLITNVTYPRLDRPYMPVPAPSSHYGYGQSYPYANRPQYTHPYQYQQRPYQNPRPNDSGAHPTLPAPRQPLQITDGPSNPPRANVNVNVNPNRYGNSSYGRRQNNFDNQNRGGYGNAPRP